MIYKDTDEVEEGEEDDREMRPKGYHIWSTSYSDWHLWVEKFYWCPGAVLKHRNTIPDARGSTIRDLVVSHRPSFGDPQSKTEGATPLASAGVMKMLANSQ